MDLTPHTSLCLEVPTKKRGTFHHVRRRLIEGESIQLIRAINKPKLVSLHAYMLSHVKSYDSGAQVVHHFHLFVLNQDTSQFNKRRCITLEFTGLLPTRKTHSLTRIDRYFLISLMFLA